MYSVQNYNMLVLSVYEDERLPTRYTRKNIDSNTLAASLHENLVTRRAHDNVKVA